MLSLGLGRAPGLSAANPAGFPPLTACTNTGCGSRRCDDYGHAMKQGARSFDIRRRQPAAQRRGLVQGCGVEVHNDTDPRGKLGFCSAEPPGAATDQNQR